MKSTNWVRLVWIFLLAAANVSTGQVQGESQTQGEPQAQGESHERFICMSGPVKRVVAIFNRHAASGHGGCRVDYTKNGKTQTVWSSTNGYAYCVAKAVSLVTKLGQGNFSCKPEAVQPDEVEPQR